MKKVLVIFIGLAAVLSIQAQTKQNQIAHIRKMYADVKAQIAKNGKNGEAPLDMKIVLRDGDKISEDFAINNDVELTFYFNKYRANSDYPDASRCYFIAESWGCNGHTRYREMLFDPNDGHLLFSFMKAETHAGFTVETRYYYDRSGKLVDQKHKVQGHDAEPGSHSWSDAESDRKLAMAFAGVFEDLMNPKAAHAVKVANAPANANRMKIIRSTYAQAKEKVTKNDKSDVPSDMKVVIHNKTWGPPETRELKFYFDTVADQDTSNGMSVDRYCYFVSERHHNNNMGMDNYREFLFDSKSHELIFSYLSAPEEGQKYEWRYYFDEQGRCIEAKSNVEEQDNGAADKALVARYLKIFKKVCDQY